MKHISIFLFSICFSIIAVAQDSIYWTLNDCVSHAMAENIDLKILQNQEKKAMYSRQQSQWAIAPSINGSGNSNLNFRRSTNQNNEISSGSTYNINYGLNSSFSLFNGFTQLNTIRANKYNELVYKESTRYNANELYLQIIDLFTSALYSQSMLKVAEEKLQISLHEKQRTEALIETGKLEKVAIYEIIATVSGNQLEIDRLKNSYELQVLQLSQLIELPNVENFKINTGEFELLIPQQQNYSFTSIYSMACSQLPQIRQKEYELAYIQKILNVTKGKMAPSLNLYGSYGSGFYSTDTLSNGNQTPFNNQLKNYLNPSMGLSLRIPIFNGFYQKYQVKRNKIDLENSMFNLQKEKKQIKREIEEAILRLEAYHQEFSNTTDNVNAVFKSFEIIQEKYHLGLINTTDFITAQNQLAQARVYVINAKFNWIVQEKLIRLYMGEQY